MKIEHHPDGNTGFFRGTVDGAEAGVVTYLFDGPERFIVERVVVNPAMRGRGYGHDLVMGVAAWAREQGLKITPWCSFARVTLMRSRKYADMVAADPDRGDSCPI